MVNSQFNQSLRPLLLLLRFIGINLFKINSSSNRCLNISYDAIWLLINSIGQIDVMVFLFQNRDKYLMLGVETVKKVTSSWNVIIDLVNFTIQGIGGHLALLFVVRPRWGSLVETFSLLEDQLDPQFFIKLHRIALFCVISLIFWV